MRYPFLMLCDSNEDSSKTFFIDDACLPTLCQHVQLTFIQHMYRIKHAGLILNFCARFHFLWSSWFTDLIYQVFDW